jgi:peptidoglycan/LPS O-acetylase OafA/YrhL
MFGTLRLLLAAAVALSHLGIGLGGLNIGVPAVVVFYLISGYVIRALLDAGPGLGAFYADRALRLAPQYLFFLLLGAALWALGATSPFLACDPGPWEWAANLLVVPLNYFMFNGLDAFTLIPPAWSLGCEIQFYLLAPWLWRAPPVVRRVFFGVSLLVYGLALGGWLETDAFGYRLLPGVLWIFLLGGWLHELPRGRVLGLCLALWLAHWLLLGLLTWQPGWRVPFNREVALGLVVGLPLLAVLARLRLRSWDTGLGHLSYGLFLAHFALIWTWQILAGDTASLPPVPLYLGLGLLLAGLGWWLVERPVTRLRRRWRHPVRASRP